MDGAVSAISWLLTLNTYWLDGKYFSIIANVSMLTVIGSALNIKKHSIFDVTSYWIVKQLSYTPSPSVLSHSQYALIQMIVFLPLFILTVALSDSVM